MSLVDMWRPRGRRRFNQADAIAARAACEHWMGRALAAEDALETTERERSEIEQAFNAGLTQYEDLYARKQQMREQMQAEADELTTQLAAARTDLANRKAVHVDAPADLGRVRDRAEETTESINVTTIRARYGTGPVPAMPVGGAVA